jgi:hypothetical protein
MAEEKEKENSSITGINKICGTSPVQEYCQNTGVNQKNSCAYETHRDKIKNGSIHYIRSILYLLAACAVLFISFLLIQHIIYGNFKTGSIVQLGQYPYEADGTAEPLEWIILRKNKNGTALLLSRYGIDSAAYNDEKKPVTWENSTLRQRLNNDFYTSAFSEEEKTAISEASLNNEDSYWGTAGGNITKDKIFLLSFKEAGQMLKNNKARQLKATPFAVSNGVSAHGSGLAWWWLRSPGRYSRNAACIYSTGRMGDYGYSVNARTGAVRPALFVNLRKLAKVINNKQVSG